MSDLTTTPISLGKVENEIECAICMEYFSMAEEVEMLPCKHCFHEQCITDWSKLNATCPICRMSINGDSTTSPLEPSEVSPVAVAVGVFSLAFGNNNLLAMGSCDNTIKIVNPETGAMIRTLEGHPDHVTTLAFSNGNLLASGSCDHTIKIWNRETGTMIRALELC